MRWLLAFLLACFAVPAHADDNRPLTVTIEVDESGEAAEVTWKIPANIASGYMPDLVAPQECTVGERQRNWADAMGTWRTQRWNCAGGLDGLSILIDYPAANPNLATIARYFVPEREVQTILLQPGESVLILPTIQEQAERSNTFAEFVQLGFEHIWEGIDHLLFVTGLIIIAGTWRRILVTVTGFTIAHSVTLGLAALDIVSLPIRAVEAVIALSIVFLAVEIVKGPRESVTWRRPVAVSGSFGLLHGFGFAAVLREVGLPEEGLLTALFAFNLGIEIGQLIFAAIVFALLKLVMKVASTAGKPTPAIRGLAGYGLGIVSSYWLLERLLAV